MKQIILYKEKPGILLVTEERQKGLYLLSGEQPMARPLGLSLKHCPIGVTSDHLNEEGRLISSYKEYKWEVNAIEVEEPKPISSAAIIAFFTAAGRITPEQVMAIAKVNEEYYGDPLTDPLTHVGWESCKGREEAEYGAIKIRLRYFFAAISDDKDRSQDYLITLDGNIIESSPMEDELEPITSKKP